MKDPNALLIIENDLESLKSMLDQTQFEKIRNYLSSLDRLQEQNLKNFQTIEDIGKIDSEIDK